jgi:hypothetical protein
MNKKDFLDQEGQYWRLISNYFLKALYGENQRWF